MLFSFFSLCSLFLCHKPLILCFQHSPCVISLSETSRMFNKMPVDHLKPCLLLWNRHRTCSAELSPCKQTPISSWELKALGCMESCNLLITRGLIVLVLRYLFPSIPQDPDPSPKGPDQREMLGMQEKDQELQEF